jgi:hypothetical protein
MNVIGIAFVLLFLQALNVYFLRRNIWVSKTLKKILYSVPLKEYEKLPSYYKILYLDFWVWTESGLKMKYNVKDEE